MSSRLRRAMNLRDSVRRQHDTETPPVPKVAVTRAFLGRQLEAVCWLCGEVWEANPAGVGFGDRERLGEFTARHAHDDDPEPGPPGRAA